MPITQNDEARVIAAVPKDLFIGGGWRAALRAKRFSVTDPSTGESLCEVGDAGPDDAKAALDAAVDAQPQWAMSSPMDRAAILQKTCELIIERMDDLALLITLEMGKPLADSKAEVTYAAGFFQWFSGEALRLDGHAMRSANGSGSITVLKRPVGPCLLITPWNFPLAMGARKIAPAIAGGCVSVVKPAHQTPLSMLILMTILAEAGLPAGVCNLITTSSSGATIDPILHDPQLRKLSFTGSTTVGRALAAAGGKQLLRMSMELGGNAPFIVFEDADIDAAVQGAVTAKMRNMGEACTAANRFLVHEAVVDSFTDKLVEKMSDMKVGRGTEDGVTVGSLIDDVQRDKVVGFVGDAVSKGARVLLGGNAIDGPGSFFEPTVLTDVSNDAHLLKQETFGPVAPIVTFASDDEAIAMANDTEFGLVAYLYTQDLRRANYVIERLETGMVGLNQGVVSSPSAPFGGVKSSGFGREGGFEGITEYLETKYIATAY